MFNSLTTDRSRADAETATALNAEGLNALQSGDTAKARELFERATTRDAGNPSCWQNLAAVYRRLGLHDLERQALERVLSIDPRHLLALLQKASLYDLLGQPRQAAAIYKNALDSIPSGVRLPAALQPALERAAEAVRQNNAALEAFLETELRAVRARHPGVRFDRFDRCVDAMLGKRRIYLPRPTFMLFPHLPNYEFYPREDFPWLGELEAATAEIRAEFERVFTADQDRLEPYIAYREGVPLDQWAELNHSRRWSAFYLWREGRPLEENLGRCPKTAALLAAAPLADVPAHAPTAFFSILDAHSHIPPHTGVTNTRLVAHLPLIVPERCRFRVGSETRAWRPGEAWVFDDTIEHEAWNDSEVPRAILIIDLWNPYLSDAERDLVRAATHAFGVYNRGQPDTAHPDSQA